MKTFDVSKFRKTITKSIPEISTGFNDSQTWISTGNYALNYLISGKFESGIPMGKVTVFAGESGCLPATANLRFRVDTGHYDITVGNLKRLLESKLNVYIDTPDGYQKVGRWFDKGILDIVKISTKSFTTECAVNHMLQTKKGAWIPASDLDVGMEVMTKDGPEKIISKEYLEAQPCYDFEILHENHRYYADGFVSHNSGKSYICSGNVVREAQKKGIFVILIDTENALDEEWLQAVGVDTSEDKLLRISASMVNEVAKLINDFLVEYKKDYAETNPDERPKVLFVLDSMGMLLTPADIDQFEKGDLKGNMGWTAKQLKALVKNCVVKFGDLDIGLLATNHTYESQDMFSPDPKISGGCLVADTKIFLEDGTLSSIQNVEIGSRVATKESSNLVINRFEYDDKELYEITFEDGYKVKCTPTHKFLIEDENGQKYVEARFLKVDDRAVTTKVLEQVR